METDRNLKVIAALILSALITGCEATPSAYRQEVREFLERLPDKETVTTDQGVLGWQSHAVGYQFHHKTFAVQEVSKSAHASGLRQGDVLVSLDGIPYDEAQDKRFEILRTAAANGTLVKARVRRQNKELTIELRPRDTRPIQLLIRNYYEREDWSGLRQWVRGQHDNPESYLTSGGLEYYIYRCDVHESLQENGHSIDTTMIIARRAMVVLKWARETGDTEDIDRIWIAGIIDSLNYYNQPAIAAELRSELRSVTGGDSEPDQPSPSAISVATGTGVFVSSDGKIVTAYYVVEDADTISVTTSSGRVETATLVHFSRAADIAVLKADVSDQEFITFSKSNPPSSGTSVFTIGFPVKQVLGDEPKFSDGAISAMSGLGGDSTLMQITIPIQPGNSGGPVDRGCD